MFTVVTVPDSCLAYEIDSYVNVRIAVLRRSNQTRGGRDRTWAGRDHTWGGDDRSTGGHDRGPTLLSAQPPIYSNAATVARITNVAISAAPSNSVASPSPVICQTITAVPNSAPM